MGKHHVTFLLGAGASKPFDIPTTYDMATEFLKNHSNVKLRQLFQGDSCFDIEQVIRKVQNVKNLPNNDGLKLLEGLDQTVRNWIRDNSQDFEKIEEELFTFIRKKCLSPNIEKGKKYYEKLLALSDIASLTFFSTNYDMVIEKLCRELKIECGDGFAFSPFEDYYKFDPQSFGSFDVKLFKMHGSVNWWSDNSRQKVFRLGLELEGTPNIKNLMIYPVEKDDIFSYPFNIFQTIFITSLKEINELIAIGHRFNDINITSPIRVALQRKDFKLIIVNPSATEIKREVFDNNENVIIFNKTVEECIPDLVQMISENAQNHNPQEQPVTDTSSGKKDSKKNDTLEKHEHYLERALGLTPSSTFHIDNAINRNVAPAFLQPIKTECNICGNEYEQNPLGISLGCPKCRSTRLFYPNVKCQYCGHEYSPSLGNIIGCPKCGSFG